MFVFKAHSHHLHNGLGEIQRKNKEIIANQCVMLICLIYTYIYIYTDELEALKGIHVNNLSSSIISKMPPSLLLSHFTGRRQLCAYNYRN